MKKYILMLVRKNLLFRNFIIWLYIQKLKLKGKDEKEKILQLIDTFCDHENIKNSKYVHKIMKDIYFSMLVYGIYSEEYFKYNFERLSDSGRREYIGNRERNRLLDEMGNEYSKNVLHDKYKCYCKFKKFYKRKIIRISNEQDKASYDEFCKNHSLFIVKPLDKSQGKGIYCVDLQEDSMEEIWKKILKEGGCHLLEEIIVQSDALGKFHPKSVNTIRFATYMKNNKVTNFFACLRMGLGNSLVDNASAGGIFALIDIETGIVYTPGQTFNGVKFIKHPDTNICIIGYQIPKWDELCKIAEEAAKLLPEYNYISWDFALTEKGWVMVEANDRGAFSVVQMFGDGIRKKYETISK